MTITPQLAPSADLSRLREIEDWLLKAEEALALFDSLTPLNLTSETDRVERLLERGEVALPEFVHLDDRVLCLRAQQAEAVFDSVRDALDSGLGDSVIGRLLRERLDELRVEANLLRTCGRSEFVTWARRRFEFSEAELSQARHLSGQWLELPSSSSDQGQLLPLVSQLQRMAQKREAAWGVNVRVIERPLASVAAVGGDAVYVRPGARATPAEAERIFAHEVEGHLLPRLRGRAGPPPFRIGTRNCSVDEEGRAILLEERRGTLDARRKSELAVRFFVGDAAQQGRQALGDEVRRLLRLNVAPAILARTLVRAFRGGGLGREKIYVVAYLRVRDALRRTPELESWMERGRISLCGARALREDCASIQPQSNSITTGA